MATKVSTCALLMLLPASPAGGAAEHVPGALTAEPSPHHLRAMIAIACSCRWAVALASTAARRTIKRICSAARPESVLGWASRGRARASRAARSAYRIRLRPAVTGRSQRSVQLDDQLTDVGQVPG